MALPAVVSTIASSAPVAMQKANQLVAKATGGRVTSIADYASSKLGKSLSGQQAAVEFLARAGVPIATIDQALTQHQAPNRKALLQHVVTYVQQDAAAMAAVAVRHPTSEVLSPRAVESIQFRQIKHAINRLGLSSVDDLMSVVSVIRSLTPDIAQAYKGEGVINPELGYR